MLVISLTVGAVDFPYSEHLAPEMLQINKVYISFWKNCSHSYGAYQILRVRLRDY